MTDPKHRGPRERTVAVDVGDEHPAPSTTNLYRKRDAVPRGLDYRLRVEAGPRAPALYPLRQPLVVLGRGAELADLDVGDETASRRHASVEYRDGGFWLCDLGSTNGTVLNGKLVTQERLADGDEIQIGTAVIRFERA